MNAKDLLQKALDEEKEKILNDLQQILLNLPCDTSAIIENQHLGFKAGHKQARHKAVDAILDYFTESKS